MEEEDDADPAIQDRPRAAGTKPAPRSRREEDYDDYEEKPRRRSIRRQGAYATCPSCRCPGDAEKVGFTWWGGLIGPALLSHVRCRECGTCYNGTSGKSNDTAIAIYVGVSVVLVLAILGFSVLATLL